MSLYASLHLLVMGVSMTLCYPNGAPELACPALDPTACHGASTATGPPPYKLTMSSTTYQPKQNITVTLTGVASAKFKGFLLEGRLRTGNTTDSVGYFYNTTTSKNVCSYSKTGIGITQKDSHDRSSETFVWRAPEAEMGDLVFIYTVIRGNADDPSDFWHGMRSPPITLKSSFRQVTVT